MEERARVVVVTVLLLSGAIAGGSALAAEKGAHDARVGPASQGPGR